MLERYELGPLKDVEDKRMAAEVIKNMAVASGWSKDQAEDYASHELKHALADDGIGILGFDSKAAKMFYRHVGSRTPEEIRKISSAPGTDMSPMDQIIFDSTLSLPEFIKSQIKAVGRSLFRRIK